MPRLALFSFPEWTGTMDSRSDSCWSLGTVLKARNGRVEADTGRRTPRRNELFLLEKSGGRKPGAVRGRLCLSLFHLILLEFAVERGFSDAEHAGGSQFVSARFTEGAKNGSAVQLFHGAQFILVRNAFAAWIVQVRGQVSHVNDWAGAHRYGAFDGVFQFAHVARPVVSDQAAHGVIGNGSRRAVRIGEFFEERNDHELNIAFALAQRGELDLHHVQ